VVGGLIAAPPISADLKWMDAQRTRSVVELEKSLAPAYLNPQNSIKYVNSIRAFEESGLFDLARKYALQATEFNPDNYDNWRALYVIQNSTEAEKLIALNNMKRLDPLNPNVESNQ
jgi:tetratricopeptide (TPR) repeat protein